MDSISEREFEVAKAIKPLEVKLENEPVSQQEFDKLMEEMQNPVDAQRHLAVQVKTFLDKRIAKEMSDKGILSDHTRRWVESYNIILERIQKALHGDKSVNLHLHKVTHSQIAAKMREAVE